MVGFDGKVKESEGGIAIGFKGGIEEANDVET